MSNISKKEQEHNQAIITLESIVKPQYQIVCRNVNYHTCPGAKKIAGEIDLLGIHGPQWDIYEVKVGDNYNTARKQLLRAQEILQDCGIISLFYYSLKTGQIIQIDS